MYGMIGARSGEILTHQGRMVLHPDRAELEWLVPGVRIARLDGATVEAVAQRYGRPAMLLRDHPDMITVRWPLRKEDFR